MQGEFKKILEIAIPSTIAWGGHILYNIVDNLMIGKFLGSESLAISGIAGALYFIFLIFGMGVSSILTSLVSETLAEKNSENTTKVFQNGLAVCFGVGVAIFLITFFFGDFFVNTLSKQASINDKITSYLKILSFAPLFVMPFFNFERLCEGMNKAKIAMLTVIICNVFNALFNFIFLTGNLGFSNLGVNGVALSTLLSSLMELITIFLLSKYDKILKPIISFKKLFFSKKEIFYILKLGIPGGMLFFFESLAFNIASFIVSKTSIYDVAAHQILLWSVNGVLIPIFGFATAIAARVAYNVSIQKHEVAFKMGIYGVCGAGFYMVLAMFLFFIFKFEVLSLMLKGGADDLITINLLVNMLFMMIFIELFDAIQVMTGSILRGYKDTRFPALFALLSYFFISIPFGYFLSIEKGMGVSGMWIGLGCGVCVQSALFFGRFYLTYKPKG